MSSPPAVITRLLRRVARTRFLRLAAALATIAVVGASAVSGASAASLGGLTTRALTAATMASVTGAPVVLAWENFNAANGTNINGTVTDGGGDTWVVPRCTWRVQSNQADSTVGDCPLISDPGVFNYSAEVTVSRNGSTTWDAGLIVNSNLAATQFLTAEYTAASNGSLELWAFNGGWTNIGLVTNLYPGGVGTAPASIVLRFEVPAPVFPATTSVLRGYINGNPVVSATLTGPEQTVFKNATHRHAGVFTYFDGTSTFDNYHVETP